MFGRVRQSSLRSNKQIVSTCIGAVLGLDVLKKGSISAFSSWPRRRCVIRLQCSRASCAEARQCRSACLPRASITRLDGTSSRGLQHPRAVSFGHGRMRFAAFGGVQPLLDVPPACCLEHPTYLVKRVGVVGEREQELPHCSPPGRRRNHVRLSKGRCSRAALWLSARQLIARYRGRCVSAARLPCCTLRRRPERWRRRHSLQRLRRVFRLRLRCALARCAPARGKQRPQ